MIWKKRGSEPLTKGEVQGIEEQDHIPASHALKGVKGVYQAERACEGCEETHTIPCHMPGEGRKVVAICLCSSWREAV